MKTNTLFLLIALVSLPILAGAQLKNPDYYDPTYKPKSESVKAKSFPANYKKMDVQLQAGTMVSSSNGYGSSVTAYVAPSLSFFVNPRLKLTTGVVATQNYLNNFSVWENEGVGQLNGAYNKNHYYAKAEYLVTEKLKISGTILYGKDHFQSIRSQSASSAAFVQNDSYYMSVEGEYKITPGITLGFKYARMQGYSPYMYNGFGGYNSYMPLSGGMPFGGMYGVGL